ncbi:MAG TPA: ABC transporter ATP-binding protein [Polyangia bacterium]
MNTVRSQSQLSRALQFVRPHRGVIAAILALTLVVGGLSAVEPLVFKIIFDALGGKKHLVAVGIVLLLALGSGRELLTALSNWMTWRTRLRIHHALLDATVSRLHLLPVSFHREQGVGSIMTKLDRGIQGFLGAIHEIAFNVLPALVYLGVAIVIMVRLDWRLALVVIGFAPLPALVATFAAPTQIRRERTLLDAWARIYSRFNEVLSGLLTVKSFAMEEAERHRFLGDVDRANDEVVRGVGFDARVSAGQNLIMMLARVSAVALGALFILRGQMTLGTLVAFLSYAGGLFGPVQGLTGVYKTMSTASVALDALFEILDAQNELADREDAIEVDRLHGRVRFDDVSFHHEGEQLPLLSHLDISVETGQMIAIVGPSGSGKSTMMALLQRFYDPVEGRVLLDGRDLRALKQRSVRRNIGVVLQDALLFNESVRDNLAYGRPNATVAEIEAAARAANAHEFITRLPRRYETVVGERGGRLSAGERQRLAIARALLKDPPLLILDEATSALDAETEGLVQEALERLIIGRTTFVIAHRLSTVVKADRILVLRHGRIVESGPHRELMRLGGYYSQLVRRQVEGLLDGGDPAPPPGSPLREVA